MSSKVGKKGRNPGAVDNWLDTLGLYRKNVAYDETCLFRAISEQLFDCQVYHERVRTECLIYARENYEEFSSELESKKEFFEHLDKLEKHMVVCGDFELKIISKKYNRSIIIFDAIEQQIYHFTNKELPEVFLLCVMDRDHFDVVYKKEQINSAGFCQSIVYKILYEEVFKIPNVDEIVHNMLYDKGNIITQAELLLEKKRMLLESGKEGLTEEKLEEKLEEKTSSSVNIAPFPFKIAKALDPNIYRNIEYDSWGEMRREWRLGEWYYGDNKLILGTKCIYKDDNNEKHDCYIQEIIKNENKCIIYLTKLAEKRTVMYSDLSPEDDAKPWPLPYRFTKSVVISTTTPPVENSATKAKKRNKYKKRTKSESSVLSTSTAIKCEPLVDNIDAYVGIPLQMHSPNSAENATYCQADIPTEIQTDTVLAQENIPVLVENEATDGSRWYSNGYQWQPYMPQTVDPFVWPTSPSTNQNVFNFNLKPMVASAPVTPSLIPYHDPNYPNYYYNYHVESYQTYPQWSSPPFELQSPPPPRNQQQEKSSEQDEVTANSTENSHQDIAQTSNKAETSNGCENKYSSSERPTLRFLEAPETPTYAEPYAPCTPVEMYSPRVMSLPPIPPGTPIVYTTAPPPMTEVVMPTTPVIYTPSLEVPYMSSSPYIYPPTPPPTWYPAGIAAQGFIYPPRPPT